MTSPPSSPNARSNLAPLQPHWVPATAAAQAVLARLLAALVTDMAGTGASAPVGGFVTGGFGLVASADALHLRTSLERAQRAWNLTPNALLRLAAPGAPASSATWGAVSALCAGKLGLGVSANILLPRTQPSAMANSAGAPPDAATPLAAAAAALRPASAACPWAPPGPPAAVAAPHALQLPGRSPSPCSTTHGGTSVSSAFGGSFGGLGAGASSSSSSGGGGGSSFSFAGGSSSPCTSPYAAMQPFSFGITPVAYASAGGSGAGGGSGSGSNSTGGSSMGDGDNGF